MTDQWRNRIVGHGVEAPDQLLANPMNWRIHPKAQQEALTQVLDRVGWVQDVIINQRTGHVVDGHLRVSVAISRQEAGVPVVYVDLDEGEEALILASLDPLASMAVTDEEMLAQLLQCIETEGSLATLLNDTAGMGGPKEGLTDPDAVPEAPEEPVTRLGDLWVMGNHRLLCGDSTKGEDVARLMNGEKADMVFTDPPWNVDYRGGSKPREALANDDVEVGWDEWLTTALAAVPCVDNAPAYVFFGLMKAGDTQEGITAAGWRIYQTLVWTKNHAQFGNFRAHYKYAHEPFYYCSVGAKQPVWHGPNNETSVWECARSAANDFHPTQKPVELAERALTNSSLNGHIVSDPFLGGGTTLIAAERLGRRCYAMEIEPRYVDVAVKRWEDYTGQKAVLDGR